MWATLRTTWERESWSRHQLWYGEYTMRWAGYCALHQPWNNDRQTHLFWYSRLYLYSADSVVWGSTGIHHGTPEFLKYREKFHADARPSIFPCLLQHIYFCWPRSKIFKIKIEFRNSVLIVWMLLRTVYHSSGFRRHRCRCLFVSGPENAVIVAKDLETSPGLKRVFTQYCTARTNVSTRFSFSWTYVTAFARKGRTAKGHKLCFLSKFPAARLHNWWRDGTWAKCCKGLKSAWPTIIHIWPCQPNCIECRR